MVPTSESVMQTRAGKADSPQPSPGESGLLRLPVAALYPDPANPRRTFLKEELKRLADSIAARGMLLPIRVIFDRERDAWRIISGESRWHAAKLARLTHVPCLPVEGELSEAEALADQLVENMVRSDLPPMQAARGIARLKMLEGTSSVALAAKYGFHPSDITKAEALLSLEPEIQADIDAGLVPADTGYYLARAEPELRRELWQRVKQGGMKRDDVAAAVRGRKPKGASRQRHTLKLRALTLSFSGKQPALEPVIAELSEALEAAQKALSEGVKDLPTLLKRLKAQASA